MRGVESDTLSSLGRAGHDIGLGALIGGNLFARVAMHPALTEISDERERGKVLNRSWRRYGTVNLVALGAVVGGWAGARANEARPGPSPDASVAWPWPRTWRWLRSPPQGWPPRHKGCALPARSLRAPCLSKRAITPQPPRPTRLLAASGELTRLAAPISSRLSALPASTPLSRRPDFAVHLCVGFCAGATDSLGPIFIAGRSVPPNRKCNYVNEQQQDKIVQYLNEAHATELALVRELQAQIAMTPSGRYRNGLEQHLQETRLHAQRVEERLGELAQGSNPLQLGVGAFQSVAGQALALAKTPLNLVRGSGGEEKVLKNAKDSLCRRGARDCHVHLARSARRRGRRPEDRASGQVGAGGRAAACSSACSMRSRA